MKSGIERRGRLVGMGLEAPDRKRRDLRARPWLSKKERKAAVLTCVEAYRTSMNRYSTMGNLDVWYAHIDVDTLKAKFGDKVTEEQRKVADKVVGKAKGKDSSRAIAKLTEVVGVGSVGTRAFVIVMEGSDRNDPLVLQVKEAQESVLERFCGKSKAKQHGQRVVEGQRAMQTASDMLLGWCRLKGADKTYRDYYVRQLWDGKGSIDLSVISADRLKLLASACGATLAHAHARTGDRFEIASYLGDSDAFDRAILKFARAYADQNETDYARFMAALEAGELG